MEQNAMDECLINDGGMDGELRCPLEDSRGTCSIGIDIQEEHPEVCRVEQPCSSKSKRLVKSSAVLDFARPPDTLHELIDQPKFCSSVRPKRAGPRKALVERSECNVSMEQKKQTELELRISKELSTSRKLLLDLFGGELPKSTSVDSLKESGWYIKKYKEKLDTDLVKRFANLAVPKQLSVFRLDRTSPIAKQTPRAVSIGPYHHGRSHLAKMDALKNQYLRDLLARKPGKSYEQYREEVEMLEPYLRVYYSSELNLTSDEFVDMMLLDGCFIIELLYKSFYASQDENFEDCSLSRYIMSDLLTFENQIPLVVLDKLHGGKNIGSLPHIDELLAHYLWGPSDDSAILKMEKGHTVLNFYYLQFVPPLTATNCIGTSFEVKGPLKPRKQLPVQIPSALVLVKSGIVFKGKSCPNFLDITFHDGVVAMPLFSTDESFLHFLVNLVMYEKHGCCYNRGVMQAYLCFMGCLLKTHEDVTLLQNLGIIERGPMSGEELCSLFSQLREPDYVLDHGRYFVDLSSDLVDFCQNNEVRAVYGSIARRLFSWCSVWGFKVFVLGVFILFLCSQVVFI